MSKKVLVISSSLRSIVTITALISKGITDSSLKYHLSTTRRAAADSCSSVLTARAGIRRRASPPEA